MAILNVTFGAPGTSGQEPSLVFIQTNNTLAQVTTAGFLNGLVRENIPLSTNMIACVTTKTTPNAIESATGWFDISQSAGVWSLSASNSTNPLASAHIFVGNASNVATDVAMTGDMTISNAGVTAIGADKVLSSMVSPLVLKYASVAISAAEFNGMYAAPKLLVAAGGANTLLVMDRVILAMTYNSAAYAAGGVAAVQYDSTANGAGVIASTTLAAASFQDTASTVYSFNAGVVEYPFTTTVNKGLYLSNITGAFTTGNSAMVAHVWYKVIPTV